MNKIKRYCFFTLILALSVWTAACNDDAPKSEEQTPVKLGFTDLGKSMLTDSVPGTAVKTTVGFRDTYTYTSDGHFCIASLVDNATDFWQKIWVQATLLDANGTALSFKGDTTIRLETFSDAVPPRGATAFFCAIPLEEISGVPADCRLASAGSMNRSAGPVLIATEISGVRAMYPDPEEPTKIIEKVFNLSFTIENPLNQMAYKPRLVLLIYGKDLNLYFAQVVNPEDPNTTVKQERSGPMNPQEKRRVYCPIYYEGLPQPLKDSLIGRVDIQVFEAR